MEEKKKRGKSSERKKREWRTGRALPPRNDPCNATMVTELTREKTEIFSCAAFSWKCKSEKNRVDM